MYIDYSYLTKYPSIPRKNCIQNREHDFLYDYSQSKRVPFSHFFEISYIMNSLYYIYSQRIMFIIFY